jgi:hypothetical protein
MIKMMLASRLLILELEFLLFYVLLKLQLQLDLKKIEMNGLKKLDFSKNTAIKI